MSLYAGLDVGTQSVKLVAYDPETRQVVATTGHALELAAGDDGSREQRAEWWIDAIRACFAALDPGVRARIKAIGVSGQQHGFVPLDRAGNVLAPAKLWCDTSTAAECDLIMDAVGGAGRSIEIAGNPILVGYTASKLPWTREHRSQVYAQLATILLPHDYVNFWLTGERWMEHGDASGTGWLDVRERRWSDRMIAATDTGRDLRDCLPPLVEADAMFPIAPAIADELGLPRQVQVSAGGGDNMMAAIGTGNVSPGVLSMSLGTSGTLFAYADRAMVDAEGRWAAFCDSTGGWLPLICTMNCTVATEAVGKLCDFSTKEGDALLAGTRPGAGGLLMLPFLNGERTPNLPNGRGSLFGMTASNLTPANLYRAAMEGAVYSLKNGYDAFVDAGMRFEAIRLTGGGSHSAVWRQMVADAFGLPVDVPEQAEGAAFGAALQALWASQRAGDRGADLPALAAAHVRLDPRLSTRPNAEATAAYAAQYQRFLSHLDAIRPLYAG
ncbi:xylulokinase [Pseudoxanthomonas broegbernensis]|uniref:Xylulose kinase n=1 Tax=Pseudoxanthomonas broegbernensis TaxID=83619 RepID=A0A7V8GK09_9GAMM|nr:xylulokinase [Pseudoxanthomonas broegbernensis]KAF1684683.1 xylulokinase [Pseudoxanthomonas broegbernensis]MBB6066441.1 xylulokinase [Pseudoxanthomonas broegbernensis]